MIEGKNLKKEYEAFTAIDDLHIKVMEGSIYGLIGSNGAGKTTLLKTLAGIYRPDQGEIRVMGEEVYENPKIKERLLFVSDELYFYPSFTIKEMAGFYRKMYHRWNQEKYLQLKEIFPLDEKEKLHRLSKGMKRQVALWLSLSAMPDVLILDEPLDGLDSFMRKKVKELLFHEVAERAMTIIISSHNLRELEDLCDHVGVIHKGKMVLEKELDDLKSGIHKMQFAFSKGEVPQPFIEEEGIKVLMKEQRGSIHVWMVKGEYGRIMEAMEKYEPALLDVLPLTLEEVFIYEMGELQDEINPSIFK